MSFGYSVDTRIGRVRPGEWDEIWIPRTPRQNTCGLIMMHGSGNPRMYIDPVTQPSSKKLADTLASIGIPCIAGDFGNQTWGNDTAMSAIDAAWSALASAVPGMRTDKVCLMGGSMGGAAVARYSQLHPTKVAAVVGLIPLLDLTTFYNTGAGGTPSAKIEIANVWGVTSPAALPASANIAANAALAATVPLLAGYSTADVLVLPAWVTAYVAAVGGTAVVTDTTAGHGDAAIGGMPIATVAQFLFAHGA